MAETTLHASCVVVRDAGVLIRGASGSGKSSLARQILLEADRAGCFARLVCDDRVGVERRNGRLIAKAVPAIAGITEIRGMGLLTMPYEMLAVVRWVIDLGSAPARLPDAASATVMLCGVRLPRIQGNLEEGLAQAVLLRLGHPCDTLITDR
jgi:serine kinase of HPr protein (carbohydrate metabolism regulator)